MSNLFQCSEHLVQFRKEVFTYSQNLNNLNSSGKFVHHDKHFQNKELLKTIHVAVIWLHTSNPPRLFFSLVAVWPLTAQVWSPVKNYSRLIKLTLSILLLNFSRQAGDCCSDLVASSKIFVAMATNMVLTWRVD